MAKAPYILIFNNPQLTGVARITRNAGWPLSEDPNRGHPMISRVPAESADYFRKSLALYYSWDQGNYPGNYRLLRLLNGAARVDDVDELSSAVEVTCVNIINASDFYFV